MRPHTVRFLVGFAVISGLSTGQGFAQGTPADR